jgi:type VI secretion system secreted protein VgrG
MATQAGRPMTLTTPLGGGKLLIQSFHGEEMVSGLFKFTIDCVGKPTEVFEFDKLLGQGVGVKLLAPDGSSVVRNFHGHVRCITQGESDKNNTHYSLEIVPHVWMLTKKAQSRIFQQETVTAILKKVLTGFDIRVDADDSKFKPRDYCVQYRETDWNFASRLMEEEGIFYFFEFGDNSHKLVITSPGKAKNVPHNASITYKNVQHAAAQNQEFIYQFTKSQEITAGKVLLWDHCFEDPPKHFESPANIPATVTQGGVTHKLNVANDKLELYDYPGEFAQRFDGVDPGGADRPADVANVPPDGARTVEIRAQAEGCNAVWGAGASTCGQLTPGHKFTMATVAGDVLTAPIKAPGDYLVLSVNHSARMQDTFRSSSSGSPFIYQNSFEVIANSAPYRPPQYTPKPIVPGSQTATVVGPKGDEIFTDKYGRVKVQFPWDRQGKLDADSSCWLRVGTPWAGRNWGMFHLPRIGQEVIVHFMEGDPDQPIIVGSVYNAHQMPAYKQPDNKTKSWVKSNSTMGGEGYNEIRFEDKKGEEQIFIHGERNEDVRIKNDCMEAIMHDRHLIVGIEKDGKKSGSQFEEVLVEKHLKVHKNHTELIGGDMQLLVGTVDGPGNQDIIISKDKKEWVQGKLDLKVDKDVAITFGATTSMRLKNHQMMSVGGTQSLDVKNDQKVKVGGAVSLGIDGDSKTKIGGKYGLDVGGDMAVKSGGKYGLTTGDNIDIKGGHAIAAEASQTFYLKAGQSLVIEAGTQISLKVGGNFIDISSAGVSIKGTMVLINSGGAAGSGTAPNPDAPDAPDDPDHPNDAAEAAKANPTKPTQADDSVTGSKSCPS